MSDHQKLAAWLQSCPGMFGPYSTEAACLDAAQRASGIAGDRESFRITLNALGYKPEHRGSAEVGYHWQLCLPERQLDPGAGYATRYAMTGTTRGPDQD